MKNQTASHSLRMTYTCSCAILQPAPKECFSPFEVGTAWFLYAQRGRWMRDKPGGALITLQDLLAGEAKSNALQFTG